MLLLLPDDNITLRRAGDWLPKDRTIVSRWVSTTLQEAHDASSATTIPSNARIKELRELVKASPHLSKLSDNMFAEASNHYLRDPTGHSAIRDFDEFILVMDFVTESGPNFHTFQESSTAAGLIGFPVNALLDWPMGTVSGYEFFLDSQVNMAIGAVLCDWGRFLGTPKSTDCLDGWLSREGQEATAAKANNNETNYTFRELFICPNPEQKYLGFQSWDAFFVRQFRGGIRPVSAPDNGPPDPDFPYIDPTSVINNACESAPLQVRTGVSMFDTFYLKHQPYSLANMLNGNKRAADFVGGTVYQAFLSALSYHRWHAPVSGEVVAIEHVPGTYYSENWFEGLAAAGNRGPDPAGPNCSQPYISAVATRAIVYIKARNPKIGMMAIVFIGMAEVSSCEFTIGVGDEVEKGQEIGMFHYGGSSHCLLFRPGVRLDFVHPGPWTVEGGGNFAVMSALAVVH